MGLRPRAFANDARPTEASSDNININININTVDVYSMATISFVH
jgi:hypothetical protein